MQRFLRNPWLKLNLPGVAAAAVVAATPAAIRISTPAVWTSIQRFSTGSVLTKNLPPRPKPPPDSEVEESYLKGSGPGGQKINKTNSAVQLKHIPTGIVVKSQATRSRSQNRKHAREILAQKVDDLLNGSQSRSAIVGEVKKKKAASAAKKSRRKYKKLGEEQDEQDEQEEQGGMVEPPLVADQPVEPSSTGNSDISKNASEAGNDHRKP